MAKYFNSPYELAWQTRYTRYIFAMTSSCCCSDEDNSLTARSINGSCRLFIICRVIYGAYCVSENWFYNVLDFFPLTWNIVVPHGFEATTKTAVHDAHQASALTRVPPGSKLSILCYNYLSTLTCNYRSIPRTNSLLGQTTIDRLYKSKM